MFPMLITYFNICEKGYIYWYKESLKFKIYMCKIVRRVAVIDERIITRERIEGFFFLLAIPVAYGGSQSRG